MSLRFEHQWWPLQLHLGDAIKTHRISSDTDMLFVSHQCLMKQQQRPCVRSTWYLLSSRGLHPNSAEPQSSCFGTARPANKQSHADLGISTYTALPGKMDTPQLNFYFSGFPRNQTGFWHAHEVATRSWTGALRICFVIPQMCLLHARHGPCAYWPALEPCIRKMSCGVGLAMAWTSLMGLEPTCQLSKQVLHACRIPLNFHIFLCALQQIVARLEQSVQLLLMHIWNLQGSAAFNPKALGCPKHDDFVIHQHGKLAWHRQMGSELRTRAELEEDCVFCKAWDGPNQQPSLRTVQGTRD